jgi:dihydrofolate reductase
MILCSIVATDNHNAIGKNNQLLWHLPADLQFFKKTTMGCPVLMGRKTYESIGRLLPGRENIIISRSPLSINGAKCFQSLEKAINYCNAYDKVFVIGGAEIYKQTLPLVSIIYKSVVNAVVEADTFFPDFGGFVKEWEESHKADEKNQFDFRFEKWIKA